MATITINGISIDPLEEPAPGDPAANASKSNYILIQTNPSLNGERRAELARLGVTILEYVPRYSYICRYESADLQPIRSLPFVAWVADYSADFKLGEDLLANGDPEPKTFDVVFHNHVDPSNLGPEIAAAAHLNPNDLCLARHKARLTVAAEFLPAVATIDEVRHIEEVRPPELLNNVARKILGLEPVNGNPGIAFEGEGQIVVVADSGFDGGSIHKVHPAFTNGANNTTRVIRLYALGRPANPVLNLAENSNDPTGHGTHVAGSALGDGKSEQFGKIRGTAPKAHLIVQSLFGAKGELSGLPVDLHDLFSTPYHDDGARIHNNSWGSRPGTGEYDQHAREVDEFVWNHPDFVICFAAGNEGNDRLKTGRVAGRSITAPGTAKNCITVGATESQRKFADTYGDMFSPKFPIGSPIRATRMANDPDSVAAISSRGPTSDDRIKPDLVAPGTFVLSAKSIAKQPTHLVGWKEADERFFFHGGTSMATSLVAGCAAVVREFLAKVHQIENPSAALVKALLINGAQKLGQVETDLPNPEEGFGLINMANTVGPFPAGTDLSVTDEVAGDAGSGLTPEKKPDTITIAIHPPKSSLKVTLVWTDAPGEHLQNDLDLIVGAANGEERHGNVDPTSSAFDRANNVEQVIWENLPPGDAQIKVRCVRLTPPSLSQKYALVVRAS